MITTKFYNFCKDNNIDDPDSYINNKVWHHNFDPHVMADDI